MFAGIETVTLHRAAVVAAGLLALAVLWRLDASGRVGRRLRERFVLGVPWGTVVSVLLVLSVYLFVQGGLDYWYSPTVVPFTAWSYSYPLGMLTAAFSHSGAGHLVGNLVGTLTYGVVAEYAWGHYPRRRGVSTFSSWRTNPYVRAFVVFPAAVVVVGTLTSLFGLGPVVGFSGVVFAFAGFALVSYPLTTVLALVTGRVVNLTYNAFLNPVVGARSQPVFSTPWFADIAIQGHAFGLLVGVLLGLWLVQRRGDDLPPVRRLWAGMLLFAVSQSLWAVYWYRGNSQYVLYRAGGLALVTLLATLVVAAVHASDSRPLAWLARTADRGQPTEVGRADGGRPDADRQSDDETVRGWLASLSSRQLAAALLLFSTAALAGPAVGVNLLTNADSGLDGPGVDVRDYRITYAEDVQNEMVAVVDVEFFGETTTVDTSGVIVTSDERDIWTTAVSKSRLAFDGSVPVRVGGVGWRETLTATRQGWTVVGGDPVYRVTLTHDGETVPVYASPERQAGPVLAGHNVSFAANATNFTVGVETDSGVVRAPLPGKNETVTLAGIDFTREKRTIVARTTDGTELRIAAKEQYE
ncbi:Membrane associated serine protease, rhomboid family [Halogranum gelatinilyticum]|uniref:Membrane associated serine protease, rhomboid family n=1 Tax=Halogranum gelatinilyticum TaxID=660521 RepID=A0A1G9VIL2_9EURY|nr:rhomboid family intramembrane serine protease [Halogranum gelatinilyticum]SDM71956.1 Membrane associated serine protease, rhomboid family [Halogranum gelatinilyticum]